MYTVMRVVILKMVMEIRLSNWVVDDDEVQEVDLTKSFEDTVDPRLHEKSIKFQEPTLIVKETLVFSII